MQNYSKGVNVFTADNFMLSGKTKVDSHYVESLPVGMLYDERCNLLTFNNQISIDDMTWYKNYLSTVRQFTQRTECNTRMLHMLDLGYIPAVYLPTCVDSSIGRLFQSVLDHFSIPNVTMYPSSFVVKRINFVGTDIWVNKMDISEFVNKPPERVTCSDLIDFMLSEINKV